MLIATMPIVERMARVLAAYELSNNADGDIAHAALDVRDHWHDHVECATAVLRAMREPDQAMANAGDPAIWEKMVAAALGTNHAEDAAPTAYEPAEPGTDPMHEGP
ncbi:MAG: hypothetical protein JWL66_2624 [Sphingomonadales bacterium]|jgi:hypothetical protein|nr:hypothetical protein [Sphingomonadales bacterium]